MNEDLTSQSAYQRALAALQGVFSAVEQECGTARAALAELTSEKESLEESLQVETRRNQELRAALDAAEATCAQLQHRLSAESAERTRLSKAVESVQRALTLSDDDPGPTGGRTLRVVGGSPGTPPTSDGPPEELRDYVSSLLANVEAMYEADVRSRLLPADVVERLTANLRYAAAAYARRAELEGVKGTSYFEEQLALVIDASAATPLGRHLAIAAYASTAPQGDAMEVRSQAQAS